MVEKEARRARLAVADVAAVDHRQGLAPGNDQVIYFLIGFAGRVAWRQIMGNKQPHPLVGYPRRGIVTEQLLQPTGPIAGLFGQFATGRFEARFAWLAGAGLMGVVVVKLFFFDLDDSSQITRIVSFITIGILMLITGYFSPLPPRRTDKEVQA